MPPWSVDSAVHLNFLVWGGAGLPSVRTALFYYDLSCSVRFTDYYRHHPYPKNSPQAALARQVWTAGDAVRIICKIL